MQLNWWFELIGDSIVTDVKILEICSPAADKLINTDPYVICLRP